MIRLKKLGHIQLRVADLERSKAFYRDVLGFRVAEQDPKHGDLFMTLGEDFHTLDMAQHENPESARGPARPVASPTSPSKWQLRGARRGLPHLASTRCADRARAGPREPAQHLLCRPRRKPPGDILRDAGRACALPRGSGRPELRAGRQRRGRTAARLALRAVAPQQRRHMNSSTSSSKDC